MTHGSLFSGIGGFDLAAEWMGWDNVFHCEWAEFPRKILSHYWPEATSYNDITTTDFSVHRGQIDILTGGFPCQPYSAAGKRKGKDDDRHLWPHMLRCIREVKPRWVVGENVFGLATWNGGLVFEEVCAELEAEGYAVQPFVLPAAAVNAPHRRDRVWFVAYAENDGHGGRAEQWQNMHYREWPVCKYQDKRWDEIWPIIERPIEGGSTADTTSDRRQRTWEGFKAEKGLQEGSNQAGQLEGRPKGFCGKRDAANPSCTELQGSEQYRSTRGPWQIESQGRQFSRSVRTTWQDFPTQPPICGGDDGLPAELDGITFPKWRAESIKGYGNAIVPQVALQIFRAIEQYEQQQQRRECGTRAGGSGNIPTL